MGVVHGRRRGLRLHLVNVPRVSYSSPGGSRCSRGGGCCRRVHPGVVLRRRRRRRVGRRGRGQQVGVGHVVRVVGVLVGVVRVSGVVRVVVAEAAGVVVGHRDRRGGGLPQRAHAGLAMADDAPRAGDGRGRRERPDESGEVPWNAALEKMKWEMLACQIEYRNKKKQYGRK